jgi:outer membrane protein
MKRNYFALASTALGLGAALINPAAAQQASSSSPFSISFGMTRLTPSDSSSVLSAPALPDTRVDVGNSTALTGALNYRINSQVSVSIPLGLGFKSNIVGAGNPLIAGLGKLATVKVLPVTALGQYHFGNFADLRPFIGGGLTYAKFFDENSTAALTAATNPGGPATTQKTASKLAPTVQIGAAYDITRNVFVEASYAKTFLKTKTTLSTNQTIDLKLNPNAFTLQVGYRF